MRAIGLIYLFLNLYINCVAQEKVSFYASDSLKVTADLYLKDYNLPFIILYHQTGSSRGEYTEIANHLLKLNYNCLAVDLRAGDKMNFITNETSARALSENFPHFFLDTRKDIDASIQYISKFNALPVVLFGSSYSASLCLVLAKNNSNVNAVIAFSPGEFFRPELIVRDAIAGLNVPVFIYSSNIEYEYVIQMVSGIAEDKKTIYKPLKSKGVQGAKALWQSSESSDECWLELIIFFKKLSKK